MIFRAVSPWNLTDDLQKTIGHLFYATSSFEQHLVAIGEFKPEMPNLGKKNNNRTPLLSIIKLYA